MTEYKTKKLSRIQVLTIDPERKKHLDLGWPVNMYASFFQMIGPYPATKLGPVTLRTPTGVLKDLGNPKKDMWEVELQFYRFDGDTLTERIDGALTAK